MASYSSISNEDKNNHRSDPTRMNNVDQTRLARLRPEKLDDAAVKKQISVIQQACGDVNQDIIALVFHECDYDMQTTISRIQTGDYEDGGWQTAKSNNKKKNHNNLGEQILNGGTLSDSERSLSQRTSPTSSLRGGHHYQSSRTNTGRRGNNFIPSNPRYPPRDNSTKKSVSSPKATIPFEQIPSEIISPVKQSNEDNIQQITSPSIDEYEFVDGTAQTLRFDNSQKKPLVPTGQTHLPKRRIPSLIPQVPVSMHPTVQFPTKPIDIQFGDVQWNDSVPMAVSPSNESVNLEQETSAFVNAQNQDVQNPLSTNYIDHQTMNELEITNRLSSSSLSIVDNTIPNNLSIVPPEGTSHLSDHLTDTSSPIPTQYPSEQQAPLQMSTTRLPPTSTPRAPEYSSPTSQIPPSHLQQTNQNATSSAFTPFNNFDNYQSIPRDYSHPASSWNAQSTNYKTTPKGTMIQTGNYQQQQQQPTYHLQPQPQQQQQQQQQQLFFRPYAYPTLSPTVFQVLAPIEHWSTPVEPYTYPATNYLPPYPNQQQYHPPTKYDRFYDKDFLGHYGQTRASNNDSSYPQQSLTSLQQGQQTKDSHITSKLSPNAATFSQGVPLPASTSATAVYINPVTFQMPTYYPQVAGSTHQDRILSYPSVDNQDNRNGASYSGTTNRNNYYHHGQQQLQQPQQQQRPHNTNASNSSWHLQQ